MKALVLSDSHRDFDGIMRAVENEPEADMIIHAGDVYKDVEDIQAVWSRTPCVYVIGNNDFSVYDPVYQKTFMFSGKRIFLTHGHLYGVKRSLDRLIRAAKEKSADICIFGHTHAAYVERHGDLLVVNPGSSRKSYAVVEITDGNVSAEIKKN